MSVERDSRKLVGELKRAGSPGAGDVYEVSVERLGPEHQTARMSFEQVMSMCEYVTATRWDGLGEAIEEAQR